MPPPQNQSQHHVDVRETQPPTRRGRGRSRSAGPAAAPDERSPSPSAPFSASLIPYCILIALLATLPYLNSFSVPFVFDDLAAIPDNPTIRNLASLGQVLSPPAETTVYGRPVLNLSFAINHALSGTRVWSYHLANILIHAAAALALFALVRRTLLTGRMRERFGSSSAPLAAAVAALWATHPLHTECVTYVVQRAESLVGLFYFLTLACFLRAAGARRPAAWSAATLLFCALGMGTKEVMATAPFVVLLFDRTFLAGSFRGALRERRGLHIGLFSTLVIVLGLAAGGRPGSAGFGEGMAWYEYAWTQPGVLLRYLALSFWPRPLVFDYLWPVARGASAALPALILIALAAVSARLVIRNRPAGFAAAWVFLILAPSSSVIPIVTEVAAEHRMYLPLAGIVALAVLGSYGLAVRAADDAGRSAVALKRVCAAAALVAAAFAAMTFVRNRDYRTAVVLWQDTVDKRPANARAQYNLAKALEEEGRPEEAVARYQESLRLRPAYADAHSNLGLALSRQGRFDEAMNHFASAVEARPDFAEAHNNMGLALARQGRPEDAAARYLEAIRLKPGYAPAWYNLGNTLAANGKPEEAAARYAEAVRLQPDFAPAYFNMAHTFERLGRDGDAATAYLSAIRVKPDYAKACLSLALLYQRTGNEPQARRWMETAQRLQPDLARK